MLCNLCPRRCNSDRRNGNFGFCGVDDKIYIARVAPHYWEEPCISGQNGSGAVFFSGCNLGCIYCQNKGISHSKAGKIYSTEQLAEIFKNFDNSSVHNINLVTPSHYADKILQAIDIYKPQKPLVYNTSSYEFDHVIEKFRDKVNIFLPDFKYCDNTLAEKLSFANNYPEIALKSIDKMVDISPLPTFENGLMMQGVIVRHLVLPGFADHSMKCLKTLHRRYGNHIYISIMKQFTPVNKTPYDCLNRSVTDDEYQLVLDYADYLGIEQGFTQTGEAIGTSFIPEFDEEIHQ